MIQNTSNIQDSHDNESSQILYKHSWVNRFTNFVAGLKTPSYELLHNIGRCLDLIINEMRKGKGTQDNLSKLRDNFSTLTMTNDWL